MPVDNETLEERDKRRQQQADKTLEWLNEHWKKPWTCPVCQNSAWGVNQTFDLREYEGGNITIGGGAEVFPVTPVVCKTCGYTFFMNALMTGAAIPPKYMLKDDSNE